MQKSRNLSIYNRHLLLLATCSYRNRCAGDSVVMFYSLVGPEGSAFKINELEMEVYFRDVGRSEPTKLTCDRQSIKESRGENSKTIADAEFPRQSDKYVLTSIEGRGVWKATNGAKLKLKLFKGQDDCANSAFTLAEIKRDAPSEGFTPVSFKFMCEDHSKEDVFGPRSWEKG